MLRKLHIQNYALIDSVEIAFGEGLNILTGETGAGKSIILGALGLIMGQRAENKVFFDESRKCIIEGEFAIQNYDLQSFFESNDLDYSADTIIRRELSPDGKSRAFVNDTPVNLTLLKALSESLIDIHSQHATLQVANPDFQISILDNVAGNLSIRQIYSKTLYDYKQAKKALRSLIEKAAEESAEADYKQFLFDELKNASLYVGEAEELEAERDQLEHAEEIQRAMMEAIHLIHGADLNIDQQLHAAVAAIERGGVYLPFLEEQAERLRSARIEIRDVGSELEHRLDQIQVDENRLQTVQDRLSLLYNLQQKHRLASPDHLVQKRDELEAGLQAASSDQARIEELEKEVERLLKLLREQAVQLRNSRIAVIPHVKSQILQFLSEVGMQDSQLEFAVQEMPEAVFKSNGADLVELKFSANKGQALQSVGKVASGGELSRLMLAIKTLMASHSSLPTILFDEIDTGISGEVALRVGHLLEQMGEGMQVIVISHLPQIASKGKTHYKVFKSNDSQRTSTGIRLLNPDERIVEIAQMLSGANPGDAALEHARNLLVGA